MNCPVCNLNMKVINKDSGLDERKKKVYDRIVYWCEKDDVWVAVEIPKISSN